MPRIYLCPVVGADTPGVVIRSLVDDLIGETEGFQTRSMISSVGRGFPGQGRPRLPWCLVWVDALDYSIIDADARCFHLTTEILDGSIRPPVRNRLRNEGVMTNEEFTGLVTNRDLLMYLLHRHYPHVQTFDQAFPGVG